MTNPTQNLETAIVAARAAVAPRVTPADIEAAITSERYFSAADGLRFLWLTDDHVDANVRSIVYDIADSMTVRSHSASSTAIDAFAGIPAALGFVTVCVLILRNGTKVVGVNEGPVSASNFDAELGRKLARQKAVDQIWPLMGYELRSKLAAVQPDFKARVRAEYTELDERIKKLSAFFATDAFAGLGSPEMDRMQAQHAAMCDYSNVLSERIAAFA